MSYRCILVTGGCGFVGSALALALRQAYPEAHVIALDNFVRAGSRLNESRLATAGVEVIEGDVRDEATFARLPKADLVLDCAAEPSVLAGTDGSPRYVIDTNLIGTLHLLEYARAHSARVFFLSTSRVYPVRELNDVRTTEGETRFAIDPSQSLTGISVEGVSEAFPLGTQRTLYGATKLASELFIQEYGMLYELPFIINRCGVIAGPWQFGKVDQGIAALWMSRFALSGKPLSYIGFGGTGKQVRDFLHIDDLTDAVLYQLAHFEELSGELFNLGGGPQVSASLRELTTLCERITGTTVDIGTVPETRWGDVKLYVSDATKFRSRTGWKPTRSMETLMRDIHAWMCERKEELLPFF